jgi:hypothetical protein
LIGIDQSKPDPIVSTGETDPNSWFGELETFFVDKHHPEWRFFQVAYDGKSVYAIAFGTSEFPFLLNLKKANQKAGHSEGIAEAHASELIIREPGLVWFVGELANSWDDLSGVDSVSGKILLSLGAETVILPVSFESRNVLPALG